MIQSFLTAGTWQNKVLHFVVAALSFGLPVLTLAFPEWQNITLGAIVYAGFNYLSHKAQ